MKVNRTIDKYKSSLVVKKFKQQKVMGYFGTYSYVLRINFIQMLLHKQYITFIKW